jgi:hypothetical protein
MNCTLVVDTTDDDQAMRDALVVLSGRRGERAANLRERFRFTIADHARDGGCFHTYQGECPAGHGARLLLEALR